MSDTIKKIIRLDMDIESLRSSAETARKLMENMENSGKPPQKLISSFEKVDKILSKIEARTKDGIFRGTDAEYNALQSELNSVGEEFEFIQGIITKIGAMDDDVLSKFLTKEDIQVFNKATKALKQYQSILKSLETNGSSVLVNAKEKYKNVESKLNAAKEKQSYRGGIVEEKKQTLTDKGYFAGKEIVSQANTNLKNKQSELAIAQQKEKESKIAITSIDSEIKAIEARMEEEKTALEEQFKELKNAKAAFVRIQKFYETPDENGNARDTSVDYGDKSYQRAQERVRAAEARVQSYTDLKNERQGKLQEKTAATGQLSEASKEVKALTVEVNKSNQVYQEALRNQEELEDSLKDTIREWKEATEIYSDVTSEVEKLTRAEEDAQRAIANAEANEEVNKKTDLIVAYKKLCQEAEEMGIELNSLGISMEYSEESEEKLTQAILKHKKVMVDGIRVTEGSEEAFEKMDDALVDNRQNLEKSRKAQEEYNEELKQSEAFEAKIKQFLGMAGAIELLRRALKQAFETTKELDAAMGEMAVVTDLEVSDYWKQLPEHTQRASELGVAIKDVYEAETLYYQQGLKTAEAQELANSTLKMARIAGLDAAEATDKMTAALRGFNMELNETSAEKVADVYSKLAAITAADVNEISSAMTKTASIASSAGMEFETTAAFLSQIIETTRESAETAGTAMKTVIARFQELKKSPEEIGEIDGEIVDANAIETALRSVGVSLRDVNGQFRNLDDVFLELSSKWNGLTKNTQRYIATIAAGSRQQSRFIAMMSDYGRTQELVTAANNSAGASQKQFEKTLETLEVKLTRLKNAWDEFSMGILQNDLVKFGVDALTTFLRIINKATSALDGLGGTVTKVLTTIALFKLGQKVFDGIKKPISNFFTQLVSDVYTNGVKAGKAFAQGLEDSKQGETEKEKQKQEEEAKKRAEYLDVKEKKTVSQKIKDITGLSELEKTPMFADQTGEDWNKLKEFKKMKADGKDKTLEKNYLEAKAKFEEANKPGGKATKKQQEEASKNLQKAEDELVKYKKLEEEVQTASQKGWEQTGKSLQQVGTKISALGVGLSLVGGVLSELGLEEAGEVFAGLGNTIMIAGGAISALGIIVPIVEKILIKAGVTTSAAWAPLLITMLAIAAAIAVVVGVIALIKAENAKKLENRMAAAAEATEKAKEEAQAAKEAYDDLLSKRNEYNDIQKNLENLTYGTKEWKEALYEANQQVLDLVQTYPQLAQFMSRGKDGQLVISDEGWDNLVEQQKKTVSNTQGVVLSRQMDEQKLKQEQAEQNFVNTVIQTSSLDSSGLIKELKYIYLTQNSSLEEQSDKVEQLADKYGITTDEIKESANALMACKDEMSVIAEQSESIARANLTAQASESITSSALGDEVIDSFAQSIGGKAEQDEIDDRYDRLRKDYKQWGAQLNKNAQFQELAREYNVDYESGNDKQNLRELYAAMTGKTMQEVKDSGMKKDDLAQAIIEMQVKSEYTTKMDEYLTKLEKLSQEEANNISSLFSDNGRSMTAQYASDLMTGMDQYGKGGELNNEALLQQAKKLGFNTIADWAKALGKTEEQLKTEAETNIRQAVATNTKTFSKLNQVLGKTDGEITKFGKNTLITTENNTKLAEKSVNAVQAIGQKGGQVLQEGLNNVLNAAQDDADKLASILGTMNWSDSESWEKLPDQLEAMGVALPDTELQKFIELVQNTGVIVDTVNFDKLNTELESTNKLIKAIRSGEQDRIFDKTSYDDLVKANEDIASQFVQIGEEFHYVGTSLLEVADQLQKNNALELGKASYQLEKQLQIAKSSEEFEVAGAVSSEGKKLSLEEGYSNWSEEEMKQYLVQFRNQAMKDGVDTLRYITDEQGNSLNFSFGTNIDIMSKEQVAEVLKGITLLDSKEINEKYEKSLSDSRIAQNLLLDTATLKQELDFARNSGQEQTADEYSKALSIQAAQTGLVSEKVISEYNDLISQDLSNMSKEDRDQMSNIEAKMIDAIDRNTHSLEELQIINNQTQKVMDALYNIEQNKIEKLSNINDSINEANQTMINKLQQQINENRKQRENQKAEQSIIDKQSQLSYLMADSSGAGALEAQALREAILAEQESYQDSLIDQGLQKLADDNALASDQRERQIALLEAQLEHAKESGELMREAEFITIKSLAEINAGVDPLDTEMYAILEQEEKIKGEMATNQQQEAFSTAFIQESVEAANAQSKLQEGVEKGTKESTLESLNTWLQKQLTKEAEEQTQGETEKARSGHRETMVEIAANKSATERGGLAGSNLRSNQTFQEAYALYKYHGGGSEDEFYEKVVEQAKDEWKYKGVPADQVQFWGLNDHEGGNFDLKIGTNGRLIGVELGERENDTTYFSEMYKATTGSQGVAKGNLLLDHSKGVLYIYSGNSWYNVRKQVGNKNHDKAVQQAKSLLGYKTGGLADFTGPAWLDGTKARPEMVLNARDTQNFIQLKDILSEIMNDSKSINNNSQSKQNNTNSFDIDINIEKISDDYDVEQLADKIRTMLYNDASYRNVNNVSLMR